MAEYTSQRDGPGIAITKGAVRPAAGRWPPV